MVESSRIASIIMAGGKGTRMGIKDKHKSTFEIAGKPAIIRLLENLRAAGVTNNIIVVGAFSDQIMGVVSKRFQDVAYVYRLLSWLIIITTALGFVNPTGHHVNHLDWDVKINYE